MRAVLVGILLLVATFARAADEIVWRAISVTPSSARIEARIAPGWHLYSLIPSDEGPIPTSFKGIGLKVGKPVEPKPIRQVDKNFGVDVRYFEKAVTFEVPFSGTENPSAARIAVDFQICKEFRCSPPTTIELPLSGTPVSYSVDRRKAGSAATSSAAVGDVTGEVQTAQKAGLGPFLLLAFGSGLLALLTPCVFPMVPITVSYFAKRKSQEGPKTRGAIAQAFAFCLGIVGTYTVFGLGITLLFGASSVQRFATSPWTNLALAALFVYLALNLFGLVQLSVPAALANRFSAEGKGGLLGPAIMGFTFTLTSFTCTVGFVGAVFGAAASGSLLFPLLGMLAFSSAFALPFFLLALFPSLLARLPKSGSWMETVKATMGFVEIMAALKFLSNADLVLNVRPWLSRPVFLGIWAGLALVTALWLFRAFPIPTVHESGRTGWLRRGFALAFVLLSAFFLSGLGGRGLGTIDAFLPPGAATGNGSFSEVQRLARVQGKPILLNFTGVTCTNCRYMEANIFPNVAVKPELDRYVVGELYTDRLTSSGDRENRALQLRLIGSEVLPAYVLLSADGQYLRKFEGSTNDPAAFAKWLRGTEQ